MSSQDRLRCDIVIPAWNNLEITRDCVESVFRHTDYPFRIIIVDNASEKEAAEYFMGLRKTDPSKVLVLRNDKNLGFVKAVNQGMRYSDAEYVCVLNNDTLATDGWLDEMIDLVEANPEIGLINPSSNSSCQFPGKMDIDAYARTLSVYKGTYQELYVCRAFAMVATRSLINKIGYLDDDYGMGYYDDTDYSKRAQAAGFKTVRAKASYVYHLESQSFSKMKEKGAIFLENEKKFIAKWGRPIRAAYVVAGLKGNEIEPVSNKINNIARSGHQAWVFTDRGSSRKLKLIDHDSIRVIYTLKYLAVISALYRILKRKRKKKMHLILTNRRYLLNIFKAVSGIMGADAVSDSDFSAVETKIKGLSHENTE